MWADGGGGVPKGLAITAPMRRQFVRGALQRKEILQIGDQIALKVYETVSTSLLM